MKCSDKLKDFKNATIEIHKINNFLIYQFYWNLAKININMSRKHDLNFISKWLIILEHQSIKRQYPKNQKLQYEICLEIGRDLILL